jgi:hemoglobin/transferrin/lactoferrin receptor protein
VAVEIDSVPAASGFAVGAYSDTGRAFVDPAFVDRVEFLKGPASSLYGSDALGGVVAYRTVSPATLLHGRAAAFTLTSETGYQNEDDGWHAAVVAAGEAGPTQLLFGYVRREGGSLATAADVTPDPRDYVTESVLAKMVVPDLPGGPLTLTAEGATLDQQTSVDAFLLTPGRFVNTTTLEGDDSAERLRVSVEQSLTSTVAFDAADWRVHYQGTETRQDTLEFRRAVPPRTPPQQIEREFMFDERSLGLEFNAVRAWQGDRFAHETVYGLEVTQTRIDELRNGRQTNATTGAVTNVILGEAFPLRDLPVSNLLEAGVFAQDEIRFSDRWSLIPAVRVDYYDLSPQVDRIYREDNPTAPAEGLDTVSISPKLGLVYSFDEAASLFFQYAHGFRAPPPEDVNIGLEIPAMKYRAVPNPDLEPETSDGYELGLRVQHPKARLSASVYYNDYRNFIESKVNLGVEPATGVTLFQSQNVASARIYGAELAATLPAGAWAPALDGWTGRLSASWSRGDDLTRDEPLNSIDPPSLVAGLRYDATSGRWGSELVMTAFASKDEIDDSRANLYATDGYITCDWLLDVDLGRGLRLNAGVFNLADVEYIDWADVRGRVVGDPLVQYYTRPGRNASVTLHWSF